MIDTNPVYTYRGHENVVREFLWWARDGLNKKVDGREFQLVTWSEYCNLRLWQSTPGLESRVNFVRGDKPVPYNLIRTVHHTFHTLTSQWDLIHSLWEELALEGDGQNVDSRHDSFGCPRQLQCVHTNVRSSQGKRNMNLWRLSDVLVGVAAFASHYGSFEEEVGVFEEVLCQRRLEKLPVGENFPKVWFEKINVSTGQVEVTLNGQLDENYHFNHWLHLYHGMSNICRPCTIMHYQCNINLALNREVEKNVVSGFFRKRKFP